MSTTAEHTNPQLWDKVKKKVTSGSKGGKAGQWSARKAQMATAEYKKEGGGFKGEKRADNSLHQWTEEEWNTKSGKASGQTGERYLPKKAREHLSDAEYTRTTEKKRRDTKKGKQFSAQPGDVAEKTAKDRHHGGAKPAARGKGAERSKAELYAEAKKRDVAGRSKMSKAELERALAH
ncbi:hypothetical protein [Antarcticirhabdus aurantiaca]|uniref:Uncharacterized protein n=1 Tax=Antarcticirhabdus aurantiaca TaxID=2606717 RepID=A0ACD4NPE2_9HYPH|nr:hypothetical protein [Antarcticirhabdus aurantiaca]WAJ28580.1 hypothetical protein OXU80_27905 [Jeongeuplla avenae]